jgi:hypothetical protein
VPNTPTSSDKNNEFNRYLNTPIPCLLVKNSAKWLNVKVLSIEKDLNSDIVINDNCGINNINDINTNRIIVITLKLFLGFNNCELFSPVLFSLKTNSTIKDIIAGINKNKPAIAPRE